MTRAVARSLTILVLILGLTLASMVPTASAGSLGGSGNSLVTFLIGASPGTCAYIQNALTGTFFVAIVTNNPTSTYADGITIIRIPGALPDQFSNACTFVGTF
jgi:hypothetical protein